MANANNLISRLKDVFIWKQTFDDLLRLSADRDGRKRENAVRRLGMLGDPMALPYLIERANDWVPQVRQAAYDAILNLCRPGNAPAFIDQLVDLTHLENCRRADHRGLLGQIKEFLLNQDNHPVLIQGMDHNNPFIAKTICKLVIERKLLQPYELVKRCLMHQDVIVRSMASENLRILDTESFGLAIDQALSDRYMPVRREAFQQLIARNRLSALSRARDFLLDRHVAIREIAVHQLLKEGYDVKLHYDEAMSSAKTVRKIESVLWGWTALNCSDRINRIKPFTTHVSPWLRRCALQAMAKLISGDSRDYLLRAITDDAGSVCREAVRLINKLRIDVSTEELIRITNTNTQFHVLIGCCNIASMGNKWERLKAVLGFMNGNRPQEQLSFLNIQLRDWNVLFNRSAAQPSG